MTDDIIYSLANFYRATGDLTATLQNLSLLQTNYPDSNWREGTIYYLGLLSLTNNDTEKASAMLEELKSFTLSARMYEFESRSYITVRSAIMKLQRANRESGGFE